MVYPGNNKLIRWFFGYYISRSIGRNFDQVSFNPVTLDASRATLLLANHYSWWDGFIVYHLNQRLFRKKAYVMVLDATIKQWGFMRHLGAFSIKPGSRDMAASLSYAAGILSNPGNLLLLFPQGRLHSNFVDDVYFEKGLNRIVEQTQANFQCVMAAGFTENFQHKKPSVNVYLKVLDTPAPNAADIARAYQQHYLESKKLQTQTVI